MSWYPDRDWYQPRPPPIRPANGIRAKTRRGAFGKTWWAGRWLAALERLTDPGRLARGRSYARAGQVVSLEVSDAGVAAQVQGSRRKPYDVSVAFRRLTDQGWEQVVEALAGQALYAARLLNGELPEQMEDVFAAAGASLFPAARGDLATKCSCPDPANPCKHVAAVYYLLGERFDEDPFLILQLRGRTQQAVVAALRHRRAAASGTSAPDAAEHQPEEEEQEAPPPLLAGFARAFWVAPEGVPDQALSFAAPEVDALLAKRLGTPAFWRGRADFTELMERAYQDIGAYARRLALGSGE